MRVLAIDTATAATSVAVVGPGVAVQRDVIDARRHAEAIAPLVAEAFAEAGVSAQQIDLVACGVGPGPFTGLRVGIATALGFATARGIPVVGACSLDVIARAATANAAVPVTVLTRARRAELCWATYDERGTRTAGPLIRREPIEIEGRCVGDAGPIGELAYPGAAVLASLVLERLAVGELLPTELDLPEEDAAESGAATGEVLEQRVRAGLILLPPRPIYLRRPDAVPPTLGGAA